jgi:hypothetical protein
LQNQNDNYKAINLNEKTNKLLHYCIRKNNKNQKNRKYENRPRNHQPHRADEGRKDDTANNEAVGHSA